jgi:putative acyl-CoA dehydrogenase
LIETLATVAAGTMLRHHAPDAIADGFIAARLAGAPRQTFGSGLEWADTRAILNRTLPT